MKSESIFFTDSNQLCRLSRAHQRLVISGFFHLFSLLPNDTIVSRGLSRLDSLWETDVTLSSRDNLARRFFFWSLGNLYPSFHCVGLNVPTRHPRTETTGKLNGFNHLLWLCLRSILWILVGLLRRKQCWFSKIEPNFSNSISISGHWNLVYSPLDGAEKVYVTEIYLLNIQVFSNRIRSLNTEFFTEFWGSFFWKN